MCAKYCVNDDAIRKFREMNISMVDRLTYQHDSRNHSLLEKPTLPKIYFTCIFAFVSCPRHCTNRSMTETTPTTQRDQGAPSPTHQAVTVKDPKLTHIYLHDRRDDPKAGVGGGVNPSPREEGKGFETSTLR